MNYTVPSVESPDGGLISLEEHPSRNTTDDWLLALGMQKSLVGNTLEGREINIYWIDYPVPASSEAANSSVLFMSMVHANEFLGLPSLLMGAKEIVENAAKEPETSASVRIHFIPIVNGDAYHMNKALGGGCWRANLRPTCPTFWDPWSVNICDGTHNRGKGGVDINRNFPTMWEANEANRCGEMYPGPHPFSEPESRTIAGVVENFNITHSFSFHTRTTNTDLPLLIYPVPHNDQDAAKYRAWTLNMNGKQDNYYFAGSALDTIGYAAKGASNDWMYTEHNVMAYVLEVQPPCGNQWCTGNEVFETSSIGATTMVSYVDLIVGKEVVDVNKNHFVSSSVLIVIVVALLVAFRRNIRSFFDRCGQPKHEPAEAVPLTA